MAEIEKGSKQTTKRKFTLMDLVPYFVTPAMLLAGMWWFATYVKDSETKQFDSVEDKINTKNHINESLTPLELHELKEHILNPDFHMPKKTKDSFYVTRPEYEELIGRNATTNWQTKEEIKEINKSIKEIFWEIRELKSEKYNNNNP